MSLLEQKFFGIKGYYIIIIALACTILAAIFFYPICYCENLCAAGSHCEPCVCLIPLDRVLLGLGPIAIIISAVVTLLSAGIMHLLDF